MCVTFWPDIRGEPSPKSHWYRNPSDVLLVNVATTGYWLVLSATEKSAVGTGPLRLVGSSLRQATSSAVPVRASRAAERRELKYMESES